MARFDDCGGTPLVIHWRLSRHLFFTWEIDTEALEPHVPTPLSLVEVRPGVALVSTGVLAYEGGHFGPGSPPFTELVTAAHVQPDLSVEMPVPRFCFYAISVYCDSQDFVDQEGRLLYTPTRHVPSFRADFAADGLGVEVLDEAGPIVSLRNTHPAPDFTAAEFWGQHFTQHEGVNVGVWEWDGRRFEHMRGGSCGKLHAHEHFQGLDVSRVRGCYRQMMAEPGSRANERFYAIRKLGAR